MSCSLFSLIASLVGGCGADFYARRLLHRTGVPGKARLALAGSADKLLHDHRIDEHLRVPVDEAVALDVWIIRGRKAAETPRGTVLILHGLWDSKARYFGLGERLAASGFDVVLPDLRSHGRSDGEHVTYGALEKRDMRVLMDGLFASGKVRGPLRVFGVSMGAAIAVQYAALEPRCRGVVAVAPYKDARSVVRRLCPLMSEAKYQAVWARAAEIAHFDPNDTSTTEAAAALTCPLVVVHGMLDSLVPHGHGKAVYDAAPEPKRLITVPWAGHTTVLVAREKWFAGQIERLARGEVGRP